MRPETPPLQSARVVWVGTPNVVRRVVPHAHVVPSLEALDPELRQRGVLVVDLPPERLKADLPHLAALVQAGWSAGVRGALPPPELAWAVLQAGAFTWLADRTDDEYLERALNALALQARRGPPPPGDGEAVRFAFARGQEAEALATLLAHADPEPLRRLPGIMELLLNAIEHGNLGFSGEEKATRILEGRWDEAIRERFQDPARDRRLVRVELRRLGPHTLLLRVEDEGDGFDWAVAGQRRLEEVQGPSGRGLAMARLLCFDALEFQGKGNVVLATLRRAR